MGRWIGRGGDERERIRGDLEEELESHIAMRAEELIASGMSTDDARAEAERRFGDLAAARREAVDSADRMARRAQRGAAVRSVLRGIGSAARQARRAPGFTGLSVLIFALAVGLTTATFTVVDHVMLRPLPFPAPDRLVSLQGVGRQNGSVARVSMTNWVDWKEASQAFAGTAIYSDEDVTLLTGDEARWAHGAIVYGPFFETLGLPVEAGRPLTEADGQERAQIVAISHSLWAGTFGGRPDLDAIDVTVNGRRVRVVGVVEAGRDFPGGTEIWIPAPYSATAGGSRNNINFQAIARLAPGVSAERAEQGLSAIAASIRERDPEAIYSYGVRVLPLRDVVVGGSSRWLGMLLGAVGFVLLTACANLAGLGLARGRRRESDLAVRLALGARRGQLIGEQLTEHVMIALVGGSAGVLLAALGTGAALRAFDAFLPRSAEVSFDARIAVFGVLASLAAGLLAGLAPAVRGTRTTTGNFGTARGGVRGGRGLPGAVMVGTEVAIAVTLLVGGGLLYRSLRAVASRDLGYDPDGVVVLDIALTAPEYRDLGARMGYWSRLAEVIRQRPGVEVAGLGNRIPTGPGGTGFVELEGGSDPELGAGYRVVSEGYFDAIGIPLLSGRDFDDTDALGTERVTLVNRAAAETFWPGRNPIGQRIKATSMESYYNGGTADWITVIGVVGDVRHYGFEDEPDPEMFVLHRQMPAWTGYMSAVVRLRPGAPPGALETLLTEARTLDRRLAVQGSTLNERVRTLLTERRLILSVLGVFAGSALLLVGLGIYGLVSFAVAERTREIAVRAALGAARAGIVRLVLASALRVVAVGATAGLAGAFLLRRTVAAMVVGVGTADPVTYGGAAAFMIGVAMLAALVPSLRASRLDPVEALRRE